MLADALPEHLRWARSIVESTGKPEFTIAVDPVLASSLSAELELAGPLKDKVIAMLAITVASFCFGTAYIFLKLGCVKRAHVPTHTMALWYSMGFLSSGMVGLLVRLAVGLPIESPFCGVLGGVIWAAGKICAFYAVRSELGIAQTVAVQGPVAMLTTFFIGAASGEHIQLENYLGLFLVLAGLLVIIASRCEWIVVRIGEATPEDPPEALGSGKAADKAAASDRQRGAILAVLAGLGLGMYTLPVKFLRTSIWSYAIGMAVGEFLLFAPTVGMQVAADAVSGTAHLGLRTGLPAGLLGGAMLFLAVASTAAAANLAGVAFTALKDTNIIIAGMWGILVFKEATDVRRIVLFACGSLIALGGAALMACF